MALLFLTFTWAAPGWCGEVVVAQAWPAEPAEVLRDLGIDPDTPVRPASGTWYEVLGSLAEDLGVVVVAPELPVDALNAGEATASAALAYIADDVLGSWTACGRILVLSTPYSTGIWHDLADDVGARAQTPPYYVALYEALAADDGAWPLLKAGAAVGVSDLTPEVRERVVAAIEGFPPAMVDDMRPFDALTVTVTARPRLALYDRERALVGQAVLLEEMAGALPTGALAEPLVTTPGGSPASGARSLTSGSASDAALGGVPVPCPLGVLEALAHEAGHDAVVVGPAQRDQRVYVSPGPATAMEALSAATVACMDVESRHVGPYLYFGDEARFRERTRADLDSWIVVSKALVPLFREVYEAQAGTLPDSPFTAQDLELCQALRSDDLDPEQRGFIDAYFSRYSDWTRVRSETVLLLIPAVDVSLSADDRALSYSKYPFSDIGWLPVAFTQGSMAQ